MKKNTVKILMAALSLLMALGIATGSTFAWFSLNNRVTVTGMTVSTKVGDNLQIATDTLGSTAKAAESAFVNSLDQTVEGLLEPVSTINGTSFFYTPSSNVKADGDAIAETYVAYAAGDTFDTNYGVNETADTPDALGYVDYVFQLKATNTDTTNPAEIRLTKVNLLYNAAQATGAQLNAFRVAVFSQDITSDAPSGVGTLVTILDAAGSDYQTDIDDDDDAGTPDVPPLSPARPPSPLSRTSAKTP